MSNIVPEFIFDYKCFVFRADQSILQSQGRHPGPEIKPITLLTTEPHASSLLLMFINK